MSASDTTYRVYAIKYARHERMSSANFIGGDSHDVPMPLDYFVWLVTGGGRSFVVDTGFDRTMAAKRGRHITRSIDEGLKALGVDPATVEDVSSRTCITTTPATRIFFPRRATTSRTAR